MSDIHMRAVQMFKASKSNDFETVNALLKGDENLEAFLRYSFMLAARGKETALQTTLTLSNLDKNNPRYQSILEDNIPIAAHENYTGVLDILLPLSKNPTEHATKALSHIFNSMAPGHSPFTADAATGKYLIEKGADVEEAIASLKWPSTGHISQIEESLKEVRRYKAEISGGKPAKPKSP